MVVEGAGVVLEEDEEELEEEELDDEELELEELGEGVELWLVLLLVVSEELLEGIGV